MAKPRLIADQLKPYDSKSIGLRLKENELAALNQRLKIDGFNSLADLVHSYLEGEIGLRGQTDRIEKLVLKLKQKNITDPLTGEATPTLYKNIDIEDFRYYLKSKYKYGRYGDDLVRYYQRFAGFFFTKPDIVRAETGRNRSWICDTMRRFAEYYDYKFENPEMRLLVREIIERYELNRHMRRHDQVWMADQNYLNSNIQLILNKLRCGYLGALIKFALFTGLRGEEIEYVHAKPICTRLASCSCENLHVIDKPNGISIVLVNRIMGQKRCYFTLVPTKFWHEFRSLTKADYEFRKFAHLKIKEVTNGEVALLDLRKYRTTLKGREYLATFYRLHQLIEKATIAEGIGRLSV